MNILYVKDKHVVELKHSGATIMEEKSLLAQELRYIIDFVDVLCTLAFINLS